MCAVNNRDAIALFIAQYRQCVEPRSLSFPPSDVLIKADVQRILHREMFEDAATQYLPSESYRGRVLKVLLQKLENAIKDPDEDEVLENFYFYWGDLVSKPISSQELSHVRYTMPLHPGLSRANKGEPGGADDDHGDDDREDISSRSVLTLENRSLIFASGTTGFRTWEAALHLATYLTSDAATSDSGSNIGSGRGNSKVAGKSIIELGCGTGFLSMYCAKCLGARYVAATDMQESLIDGLRRCSALNDIAESKMTAAVWTWGEELPRLDGRVDDDGWRESHHAKEEQATATGEFDIGIGADLIYDPDIIPFLVSALCDLFTTFKIKEFLISSTIRNEETFALFLTACATNHLNAQLIDFESPPREQQTGLFHSTDTAIKTYSITAH